MVWKDLGNGEDGRDGGTDGWRLGRRERGGEKRKRGSEK